MPATPATAVLSPTPTLPGPPAAPVSDEGSVVHVHIGRVDIRGSEPAVAAPAAPPVSEAPQPPAVLSLSDYLAGSTGGGR